MERIVGRKEVIIYMKEGRKESERDRLIDRQVVRKFGNVGNSVGRKRKQEKRKEESMT